MSFSGFSSSDKLFNVGTDEKVGMSLDDIIKKSRTGAKPQRNAQNAGQKRGGKAPAVNRQQNVARTRQNVKTTTQARAPMRGRARIQAVSNRAKVGRGTRVDSMRGIQYTTETRKKQQQTAKIANRTQRNTPLSAARAKANAARVKANAARLRAQQSVQRAVGRATGRPVGITTRSMAGRGLRFVGGLTTVGAVRTRLSARNRLMQPGAMQINIVNDTIRSSAPRVQRAPVKQLRRLAPAATAVARVQQTTRARQAAVASRRGIQAQAAPARVTQRAARQRLMVVQPRPVPVRRAAGSHADAMADAFGIQRAPRPVAYQPAVRRAPVVQYEDDVEYYEAVQPVYAAPRARVARVARGGGGGGYVVARQPAGQRLSRPVQAGAYDFGVDEAVYAAPVRGRGTARYAAVEPAPVVVRRQPARRQQAAAYFEDPAYADAYHPHALARPAFARQ